MPADPQHLAILEQALAESPDNVTLRLHVAAQHLELVEVEPAAGHAAAALGHAQRVLTAQPDHVQAFGVAAIAARLVGDADLAARYQRMAEALGGTAAAAGPTAASAGDATPPASPAPPTPPAPTAVPAPPDPSHPSVSPTPPFASPDGDFPPPGGGAVPTPTPIAWAADGSHDNIDGESPLWISISEDGEEDVEIIAEIDVPDVRLDDVGGLETVKRRLRTSFLAPLQNPELREMYRKSLRGGMLLYGPPGCGKTFLARAVAGELRARFFAVGLHDILDMYLGNSEKNLHEIFETARRHSPCVLFLDEIDALGHKRSNFSAGSGGRNVVVQLLNELDGLKDENEGLFVIGATNQPWDIDSALRRPGRFDRMVLVLPPDEAARVAILTYHLRERPVESGIDLRKLAARLPLYSGADLALVCESAAEVALEDSLETGHARPITAKDLDRAAKEIPASTRAWFEVAKNFAQFANEGGRYDDLLEYLRAHKLG